MRRVSIQTLCEYPQWRHPQINGARQIPIGASGEKMLRGYRYVYIKAPSRPKGTHDGHHKRWIYVKDWPMGSLPTTITESIRFWPGPPLPLASGSIYPSIHNSRRDKRVLASLTCFSSDGKRGEMALNGSKQAHVNSYMSLSCYTILLIPLNILERNNARTSSRFKRIA